jgi:hypothetical protein
MDVPVNISRKWIIPIIISITIILSYLQTPKETENRTRLLQNIFEEFEFVNNITSTKYKGNWNIYGNEKKFFDHSEGTLMLSIERNLSDVDLMKIENLKLHILANDGIYEDRKMFFNISFIMPELFNLSDNFIEFQQKNLSMDYQFYDYFDLESEGQCFNITLDLKFSKNEKYFVKDFQTASDVLYSKLEGRIYDEDCNFRMHIELDNEDDIVYFINKRMNLVESGITH